MQLTKRISFKGWPPWPARGGPFSLSRASQLILGVGRAEQGGGGETKGIEMNALGRITERVNRLGDPNDESTPRPLLTLSEFFDGNGVSGSIGCNLSPTPTPEDFHALLSGIAARPDVGDVRIQVTMFDDPDWPFSDTVWVITSADPSEVAAWFREDVAPDAVETGWQEGVAYEPYELPPGMHPVCCWWD